MHQFRAHDSYFLKCVLSPNVKQLVTTSADKSVRVWDVKTWHHHKTLVSKSTFITISPSWQAKAGPAVELLGLNMIFMCLFDPFGLTTVYLVVLYRVSYIRRVCFEFRIGLSMKTRLCFEEAMVETTLGRKGLFWTSCLSLWQGEVPPCRRWKHRIDFENIFCLLIRCRWGRKNIIVRPCFLSFNGSMPTAMRESDWIKLWGLEVLWPYVPVSFWSRISIRDGSGMPFSLQILSTSSRRRLIPRQSYGM